MKEKVLHADGTCFKVAGKGRRLHVTASERLAFYFQNKSRGAGAKKLKSYKGIPGTDCFSPCLSLPSDHALCGAHVLRELRWAEGKEK